jgi:hypothetical protein
VRVRRGAGRIVDGTGRGPGGAALPPHAEA